VGDTFSENDPNDGDEDKEERNEGSADCVVVLDKSLDIDGDKDWLGVGESCTEEDAKTLKVALAEVVTLDSDDGDRETDCVDIADTLAELDPVED
jgi:hypothetical protein